MNPKLAAMREEYQLNGLHEADVASDPISQFQRWFDDAVEGGVYEPNGMTLATADADGQPSARIVLLKMIDQRGLAFFTNKGSRKGQALDVNSKAALTFWWGPLERQVRFEGTISDVSGDEADAYYQSRPIGSRIGAWASPQSQIIESREVLEKSEKGYLENSAMTIFRAHRFGAATVCHRSGSSSGRVGAIVSMIGFATV